MITNLTCIAVQRHSQTITASCLVAKWRERERDHILTVYIEYDSQWLMHREKLIWFH